MTDDEIQIEIDRLFTQHPDTDWNKYSFDYRILEGHFILTTQDTVFAEDSWNIPLHENFTGHDSFLTLERLQLRQKISKIGNPYSYLGLSMKLKNELNYLWTHYPEAKWKTVTLLITQEDKFLLVLYGDSIKHINIKELDSEEANTLIHQLKLPRFLNTTNGTVSKKRKVVYINYE